MKNALVVVVLVAGALAGCVSEPEPAPAEPVEEEEKPFPSVFGTVFDQNGDRLPGAEVQLFELQRKTTTDPNGSFAFYEVPEDSSFLVLAQKQGYTAASAGVEMVPGFLVRVNLTLTAIAALPGLVDVGEYRGLFECHYVVTGPLQDQSPCPGTQDLGRVVDFPTYERLKNVIVETFWEPSVTATSSLQTTVMAHTGEQWEEIGSGVGESPVRVVIDQETASRITSEIRVIIDVAPHNGELPVGAGVAFQQDFETYASMFYNQPAADGYTIA